MADITKTWVSIGALLCGTGLILCGINSVPVENNTIQVYGSHTVSVAPDRAEINLNIEVNEETASEAQGNLNKIKQNVITSIKKLGVEDKNIKDNGISLYQDYDYIDGQGSKPNGYNAYVTLTVSNIELDKIADIQDDGVQNGVTGLGGVNYSYSNYDEVYNQALNDALNDAKDKAGRLANTSGRDLGKVVYVSESSGEKDKNILYMSNAKLESNFDGGYELPGEIDITAEVNVTYELK